MLAHRTRSASLILACVAGLPAGCLFAQAGDDLPVTAVTLYRSGVGSFERAGTVRGDATVSLNATADQINDLLKSLVVMDLDGGRVGAVTYTADEPVKRLLEAIGVSDPSQITLARLMASFRGAAVTLVTTDSTINGRILGVDAIIETLPNNQGTRSSARLSLLTAAGMQTVSEHDIRSLTLDDPQLRADMDALLEALAQQRTERSRSLDIELRGNGDRRVRAAYVQETPIWKTSYRIILPEDDADPVGLQGWAIVENTTDSDWEGITLSLVAGRPVGFQMDLSEPLFVTRPQLPVPFEMAAAAKAFDGGVSRFDVVESDNAMGRVPVISRRRAEGALVDDSAFASAASMEAGSEVMRQSMVSAASAGESGEVFFYRLSDPVTIGRQQSAMLPIMAAEITGRRVSISSPGDSGNPMRGVEITNSTDLKLMPGPISVYDGTAFAGDAQIGYVGAGDDRLLAFGVDLDVDTERSSDQRSVLTKLVIRDGAYIRTSAEESTQTVEVTSNDENLDRTVIVEIPRLEGWALAPDGPEPYEVAEGLYRFEVELPASGSMKLDVQQQRTIDTTVGLTRGDLDWVIKHHRTGAASDAVLEAARDYAARRAELERVAAQVASINQDINTLTEDQTRIRNLMGALSRQDNLYSRYIKQLENSEDKLDRLREAHENAEGERRRREAELNEFMRTLTVS